MLGTVHDLAEIERVNHIEQRFDDLPDRRLTLIGSAMSGVLRTTSSAMAEHRIQIFVLHRSGEGGEMI